MPWDVLSEFADELADRPWLIPFVEPDDVDIAEAESRWERSVVEARAELRRRGVNLRRCEVTKSGLETTMLSLPIGGVYQTRGAAAVVASSAGRVSVENDRSQVLRGLAVPFGEPTIVLDRDGVPVEEEFHAESFDRLPAAPVPMLVGHRQDIPPAGLVENFGLLRGGLGFEGRLVGSDGEVEGWRRRLAAGLNDGVSVGFTQEAKRAVWSRPRRPGSPPRVSPRGVRVVELSLVSWPAYESARALSLSERTARAEVVHVESDRLIAEMVGGLAVSAVRRRRRRGGASNGA